MHPDLREAGAAQNVQRRRIGSERADELVGARHRVLHERQSEAPATGFRDDEPVRHPTARDALLADAGVELDPAEHGQDAPVLLGHEHGEHVRIGAPAVLPAEQLGVAREDVAAPPVLVDERLQLVEALGREPVDHRPSTRLRRVRGAVR